MTNYNDGIQPKTRETRGGNLTRSGSTLFGTRLEHAKIHRLDELAAEAGLTRSAYVRQQLELVIAANAPQVTVAECMEGVLPDASQSDQQLLNAAIQGSARQLAAITARLEDETSTSPTE